MIMIVIVLLSGGGGQQQLRVDMCWWGGAKIVQGGYHAGDIFMVILTLFCIHEYDVFDGIA